MMTGGKMAVIWDMDGVIADTAPYHMKAWQSVFAEHGLNFSEADFRRNFGQRNDTIIKIVLGEDIALDTIKLIA
ncbi:MAG: HAD hydrolase-like protein, partial [Dehalococcoidales bacterium]